jgi:hypothetical protein
MTDESEVGSAASAMGHADKGWDRLLPASVSMPTSLGQTASENINTHALSILQIMAMLNFNRPAQHLNMLRERERSDIH